MAILLLQEKADADGSDPLSQVTGVSESLSMCPIAEDQCYESFDLVADNASASLISSAFAAIHPSGSLRLSKMRRGLPNSQGGRDLMVKYLLPHQSSRLIVSTRRCFNIWLREVRYYISLRNLRI